MKAYESSVGGVVGGTPTELVQGAALISADHAQVHAKGPANCTNVSEMDCNDADTMESEGDGLGQCAGVLDGGVDSITPLQIWHTIMENYKIAQHCDAEIKQLLRRGNQTDITTKKIQKNEAILIAVDELSKLRHKETMDKLKEFVHREQNIDGKVPISLSDHLLSSRNPAFWCHCFMRLFPRGDCAERNPARTTSLPSWRWAKTLLTRSDSSSWRQDVEFIASVYNVFLRRDQINAVEMAVRSVAFTPAVAEDIQQITATGIISRALHTGEVNSVREILKQKNLDQPLQTAFRQLQIVQQQVRGSEAEKDTLIPKFCALRLWSGCSSLFFTLNPHDIRSPLSISLLQDDVVF